MIHKNYNQKNGIIQNLSCSFSHNVPKAVLTISHPSISNYQFQIFPPKSYNFMCLNHNNFYIPVSMISVFFVPNYPCKSRNDNTHTDEIHNYGKGTQFVKRKEKLIKVVDWKFCKLSAKRGMIHLVRFLFSILFSQRLTICNRYLSCEWYPINVQPFIKHLSYLSSFMITWEMMVWCNSFFLFSLQVRRNLLSG